MLVDLLEECDKKTPDCCRFTVFKWHALHPPPKISLIIQEWCTWMNYNTKEHNSLKMNSPICTTLIIWLASLLSLIQVYCGKHTSTKQHGWLLKVQALLERETQIIRNVVVVLWRRKSQSRFCCWGGPSMFQQSLSAPARFSILKQPF